MCNIFFNLHGHLNATSSKLLKISVIKLSRNVNDFETESLNFANNQLFLRELYLNAVFYSLVQEVDLEIEFSYLLRQYFKLIEFVFVLQPAVKNLMHFWRIQYVKQILELKRKICGQLLQSLYLAIRFWLNSCLLNKNVSFGFGLFNCCINN